MSLRVTQERGNIYTVELDMPESCWLRDGAKAMGITRSAMLAASIGHGLPHYMTVLKDILEHEKQIADKLKESDNGKETESQGNGT